MRIPTATRWMATGTAVLGTGAMALAETVTSPPAPAMPDAGVSVLRVFGALLLVLALFFAGVWLFKNWQRVVGLRNGVARLTVLEVRSLGNRHALYVVGYERQRLLLASSPSGIHLITPLPEATTDPPSVASSPNFVEALQKVLNRKP